MRARTARCAFNIKPICYRRENKFIAPLRVKDGVVVGLGGWNVPWVHESSVIYTKSDDGRNNIIRQFLSDKMRSTEKFVAENEPLHCLRCLPKKKVFTLQVLYCRKFLDKNILCCFSRKVWMPWNLVSKCYIKCFINFGLYNIILHTALSWNAGVFLCTPKP